MVNEEMTYNRFQIDGIDPDTDADSDGNRE